MLTSNQAETFVLYLNPAIPLEEQIQRGNYKFTHPAINLTNFSLTLPAGKRRIVLYDPKGPATSEQIVARMKADGYIPAILDDALAMGQQRPNRQRQNPIVFLGTVWRDTTYRCFVPVLGQWCGRRDLNLIRFSHNCTSARFAAIKVSRARRVADDEGPIVPGIHEW